MATDKPVVVYGVSGYTGRLICEYLRELGVPFLAAGRDADRVREVVERIPGIETADYEVVAVENDADAMAEAFEGARVICNTAGPFIKFGPAVVDAALRIGAHYLDTTGEQDWVLAARDGWGDRFAERGLLLSPGVAHMYTTSEIAANIALEPGGYDTLDILVLWKGYPTFASTQTIFTILMADWFYLEQNRLVEWDHTSSFQVSVPGYHEQATAVPWGGMSHPIWFQNDPRVTSVRAIGGVFAPEVMANVGQTIAMFEEQIRPLDKEAQEAALAEIAASVQAGMPPRENPRINRSLDSVHASGPLGRSHVVIHGNSNYKQTGLLQAYAAYSLLQQAPNRPGFASACQAFGHRELLGQLRAFGLVAEPVVTRV
ncbi:short subunit dehydrogenase-like uncharacterized protein [Microbacterium resistens]|uniref:Short subunit dehydrogenase-like uncharacterized protein n=1 Tax=Microbacterium resistens TaxID=156977 RepID=A0ABU1SEQ5_9MICO|nr:DUF5938 domain-containing protein [Microbacterium resistens]MDR6868091.1 short subunit dehydrogenase-like uncharacterized protein [Microbacterium resistens]